MERGESFFTFAIDMTLKSTKALIQPEIPENLDPWRSKLLWASRVLPMLLVGLLIIGGICTDVGGVRLQNTLSLMRCPGSILVLQ